MDKKNLFSDYTKPLNQAKEYYYDPESNSTVHRIVELYAANLGKVSVTSMLSHSPLWMKLCSSPHDEK